MQRLIAVLRRPQAMLALVSDRRELFAGPGRSEDPYHEQVLPLSGVSEAVCPWKEKDLKAWRALSRVPGMSERAGLAIVRSIIGSVTYPGAEVDAPPPLAFGAAPMDLRPQLCCPDTEQLLLDQLEEVLEEVSASVDFPDWHWKRRHDLAELPSEFRKSFLWGLHLSPWRLVELTLGVYVALELEERPPLRRAIARLLSLSDRPLGILWCDVVADLEPAHQVSAVELILETSAYTEKPGEEIRRTLTEADWPEAMRALAHLAGE